MNALRDKLTQGRALLGTQAFMGCKEAVEVLGGLGYDFIFLCTEHPAYGIERLYDCVKACRYAGTPALVRLPDNDAPFTKKALDMGGGRRTVSHD